MSVDIRGAICLDASSTLAISIIEFQTYATISRAVAMTALNDDFQSLALLSIQPKDSQRDSQRDSQKIIAGGLYVKSS